MGIYIFMNKDKCDSEKKSSESEINEKNKKDTTKPKCYGTYYVNGNQEEGIFTLKEDGTYQVENEERFGVFVIHDNTITFIEMKHTTGPREEDPTYNNPHSYLISDDCSKIRISEPGSEVSTTLEKAN